MEEIVNVIIDSIEKAEQIKKNIALIKGLFENSQELEGFNKLIQLIKQNPGNVEIIKEALLLLQFVNDENVYSQYTIDDIERFYIRISNMYTKDPELIIEFSYFLSSIQDKENEAFLIVEKLKKILEKEFKEFDDFHKFG